MTTLTPDALLFDVADALQMPLYEVDGRIRGFETLLLSAGLWEFNADVSVIGDIGAKDHFSAFVKVVGNLWLYVVKYNFKPLEMYVLDGSTLKLHVKDCATWHGGKSVKETLKKLKLGIVTKYEFEELTGQWNEVGNDASALDNGTTSKNAIRALPAPGAVSGA